MALSNGEEKLAVAVQATSSSIREEELVEEKQEDPSLTHDAVEIPNDVVEEILQHLPAKNLARWKLVSKEWRSMMETEYLAEKQLLCHRKKNRVRDEMKIGFCYKGSNGSRHLAFRHFPRHGTMTRRATTKEEEVEEDVPRVPGSCDGLACVYDLVAIYLVNPLTRVSMVVWPPLGKKLSVGFGRDVVTGAYKVVVLYGSKNSENRVVVAAAVFDTSTNEWRWRRYKASPPHAYTLVSHDTNPVFANGSIFWMLAPDQHPELLLAMDLHTEKLRTVPLPQGIGNPIYMWSLDDRLCVSDLRQLMDSDVWVLVDQNKWETSRFSPSEPVVPHLRLNVAWFSPSLLSPYRSSSPVTYNWH